jgi:hypothetical protein
MRLKKKQDNKAFLKHSILMGEKLIESDEHLEEQIF